MNAKERNEIGARPHNSLILIFEPTEKSKEDGKPRTAEKLATPKSNAERVTSWSFIGILRLTWSGENVFNTFSLIAVVVVTVVVVSGAAFESEAPGEASSQR